MFYVMNFVHFFMNYVIFRELCDWMLFEVDCAKSHHRVIPEGPRKGRPLKIYLLRQTLKANNTDLDLFGSPLWPVNFILHH